MTHDTIDTAALANLKEVIGGDAEDLRELVDDFTEAMPGQTSKMQSHVADADWTGLRITSHSCKSNARDLGAVELMSLCAALELQSKNGEPEDPSGQVGAISSAAEAAVEALRQVDLAHV